jgi:MoaA/NifB/PqqE/SkfB family radical SAM enzyme
MSSQTGSEVIARSSLHPHVIRSLPVLVLMVHSRCNCRCVMCDIWKTADTRELRLADLEPHIASIQKLGVEWVVFSGGEPLMNPGLFGLARALRDLGVRLTLLTTGLLLGKNGDGVASLFDEVVVSLDGPRNVHDRIRRVPGAYDLLSDGVQQVRSLNSSLPIRARTTVQKSNFRHLQATVTAAHDLALDSISFLAADVTSTAFNRDLVWPVERQSQVALTEPEIGALDHEITELIETFRSDIESGFIAESPAKLRRIARHYRAQLSLDKPTAPICNAPWTSAVVESDGAVRPCFFHPPFGNINDHSLEQVLNSTAALEFRENLDMDSNPTCRRCVCSLNYTVGAHLDEEIN